MKIQKIRKIAVSAWKAAAMPNEPSHISLLNQLTGEAALTQLREKMLKDPEGCDILTHKPRFLIQDFGKGKQFQKGSLGESMLSFCQNMQLDKRPLAQFIQCPQLAYVHQRYKDIHDFFHILLGFGVSVCDQLIVKVFEGINLGLPSASLAVFAAPALLRGQDWRKFQREYGKMCYLGKHCKNLMTVNFQGRLEQDLEKLRFQLGLGVI